MAQHEKAYVKYSSAFPFSAICHLNGDSFKLMLYIRTHDFRAPCKSTFSATFFHPCDSIKKIIKNIYKKKKNKDANAKTHS